MSFMMTCDSCGAEIPAEAVRGSVQTVGDGTIAGPSLDLCSNCMGAVEEVAVVRSAKEKEIKKRDRLIAERQAIIQQQLAEATAANAAKVAEEAKAKVK